MKNIFNYFLIAIMALSLFISCSNEMQGEPLAYVNFGDNSRAIESTNESLPIVNDLLWKYTAVKTDAGLKTGQTDIKLNVKDDNTPGLSGSQVGPFSIGSWKFTLFGYTKSSKSSETYDKLVYQGSKIVSLSANTTTTVSVDIQYAGDETHGTLKLENLILLDSNGNNVSGGANEAKLVLNGNRKDGNSTSNVSFEYEIGEDRTFNSEGNSIEAGIWQFTFTFKDVNGNVVSNIQSKYILIMGGKTTTLSGDVREYEQKAQFEANHYYQQYNDSFWVIGNTEVALNATKDAAQKYSEDNSVPAYVYLNGDITTSNPIEFTDNSSVVSRAISASVDVVKPSKVILNLNGKQISYRNNTNPDAAIIINNPGLTLVITDNSEIQTTGITSDKDCFDVQRGSLIIEGGKHSSSATVINIGSDASVVISGNAEIAADVSGNTVAIKNSGNLLMEGGKISGSTTIEIANKDASTIIKSGELDANTTISKEDSIESSNVFISENVGNVSTSSGISVSNKVGTGTQEDPFLVYDKITFDKALSLIASNTSNKYIKLIKSFSVNETIKVSNGIVLDLNGYSIHGNKVRTFQFVQGSSTIKGTDTDTDYDTISSDVENVSSSVIRVGDNNATSNAKLTIESNVTITTDTAYGITVFGAKNEYLYVYGKVESQAPANNDYDGCAISTVGTDKTKSYIYIYDGAKVSATNTNAIYMPSGNLTVNAGEITGRTGIYVKSGSTTIKGGTITGNGTAGAYNYYGNGGVSTGDALVVDSCGYPNGKPSVSITGGTFTSENAKAVASYNSEGNILVKDFITGGTFSSDPSEYLHFIYESEQDGSWNIYIKDNSAEEPYHITDEADWLYLASLAYESITNTEGKYYVVDKDLDFTGVTQKAGLYSFAGNIDFQGHTITGLNGRNTYTYRYPSLFKYVKDNATIKNLVFELPNFGTDQTVKPVGSIQGTGTVTLENISISGNLNMTDNNTGLLIDFVGGGYDKTSKFVGTINLIKCTSTCNMINNGYSSAFIGGVYYGGNNITINATNCVNYGKIMSTGKPASMLISNPTCYRGDTLTLNITNCKNEGQIISAPGTTSYLVMPINNGESNFFTSEQLIQFETNGSIVNANDGLSASLNAGELAVTGGYFDLTTALNKVPDATRFELAFGFQGTGGLGGGGVTQYTFKFNSRDEVVNVPAYSWVNAENANGDITAHNEYGTTYYTDTANHYVYNQPGYIMNNQPEVSFVAYDANGKVMLVDYYSYSN